MHGRTLNSFSVDHPSAFFSDQRGSGYCFDRKEQCERFSDEFREHLSALNNCVIESGNNFEGSLFYWNKTPLTPSLEPAAGLGSARRNVWRVARFKRSMFEIGINAGHTALLALMSNPKLHYLGVDLFSNSYVQPCVDYLTQAFKGRFEAIKGDSREVLPLLINSNRRGTFDLLHVDGGHTHETCKADMLNAVMLSDGKGHLMLDDIDAEWLFDAYCELVSQRLLETETFYGDWEDAQRHVLARIVA